ncbi:hypothetical protein [Erythrobacter sp. SG61-1L]|uniref:hypothetical protein n=1 Tax=Erythrobacter sp. SG61-1L TaxID=1603897 RepID=UPI0012E2EC4D|nr:hypothetical protein [Erythrobacter sp. SG61-1L]
MSRPRPRDMMRAVLVLLLVGAFELALFWLFQWPIPKGNRDLVTYMLGQLSGLALAAVTFYFGTSQSSREKSDAMARLAAPPAPEPEAPPSPAELPEPRFGMEGNAR